MKTFVLSEEQYNAMVKEGLLTDTQNGQPQVTVQSTGNPVQDATTAVNTAKNAGISSAQITGLKEGRIITKRELKENRLKKLRENSELISVKDLFK
jgi:hypothetical protein